MKEYRVTYYDDEVETLRYSGAMTLECAKAYTEELLDREEIGIVWDSREVSGWEEV